MRLRDVFLVIALGSPLWAGETPAKVGYVDCSLGDKQKQTPVFLDRCVSEPKVNLACGTRVWVVGREGAMLKIVGANGLQGFVSAASISQTKDRFLAIDFPVSPNSDIPDCTASRAKTSPPRIVYKVDPQLSEEAMKKQKNGQGIVLLSLTVGTDGLPKNVKVESGLGPGLDENAIQAVEKWKFEPALKDGKPVETPIHVEVDFHLYR